MNDPYLTGLLLLDRPVLVVGGGRVAQRRLPALAAAGAVVHVVAPAVTAAVEGLAASGALTWTARAFQESDLDGTWYALALTDDPQVNAVVVAAAQRRRIFCVRADDGSAATAVTPATGRQGPVRIAVLGGGDPGRAAAVRDDVVAALAEGRMDSRARRESARSDRPTGVAIVGGGPGDPDLITVRGRRLLAQADVVVADRLAPQALLAELAPDVEVIDAAKLPRGRAMTQDTINGLLVDRALAGLFVVRLKGGDPFVFGRGYEEVLACARAGIPVRVVPGLTSAIAVPGLAGIPLTHRGVAHEAVIVSGHLAPDDPASLVDWAALARLRGTLVLLMAVELLEEFAETLIRYGRDPDLAAVVVQEGSLPTERVLRTTLGRLAADAREHGVRPPAVVVVGGVAAL